MLLKQQVTYQLFQGGEAIYKFTIWSTRLDLHFFQDDEAILANIPFASKYQHLLYAVCWSTIG